MTRIILSFLLICFATSVYSEVGTTTLTVNLVSHERTNLETVISYEFPDTAPFGTYTVTMEVSFDNGSTFEPIPMEDLSGDLTEVRPGGEVFSITWDGAKSFANKSSPQTIVRITAVSGSPYDLTLETDPAMGGTASDETGEDSYEENVTVDIRAEPNPGWGFVNWTGDYADYLDDATDAETSLTMPASNVTLTANFELIDYTLTLIADPEEGGTVMDVTDDLPYNIGDEVEIKAEPNPGYAFVNWTDNDDTEVSTDETFTYTMPAGNVTLTANFELIEYTITYNLDGGTNDTDNPATFTMDDLAVSFKEASKGGHAFGGWFDNEDFTGDAIEKIDAIGDVELWAMFWPIDTETELQIVTSAASGKTWMARNLGASREAIDSEDSEAYGDLYQWGRAADGHQKRNSGTTSTLSSSDFPGHAEFITNNTGFRDWRTPKNDDLWQGVNGRNNPCPDGYRLPTKAEWAAESGNWDNADDTFPAGLRLPVAGNRGSNGVISQAGTVGQYWSSTISGSYSYYLQLSTNVTLEHLGQRARGMSVRCIKDE